MASSIHQSALTFRLSCWVLGLIAFGQLLAAGVAVAVRVEKAQQVRVEEKVVTKYITVDVPAAAPKPAKEVVAVAPPSAVALPPMPAATPLPPPRPLAAPPIENPEVERLVTEARAARVADDLATAINKLDAAREISPKDPNVLFEIGRTYEHMAAVDPRYAAQAGDAYQAVFDLDTSGAGALFELAAKKLGEGVALPSTVRDNRELAIGRVRNFEDDTFTAGQRVLVDVPVQMAPGAEIDPKDLVVKVNFFDSMKKDGKNQVLPAAEGLCQTNNEWVSGEFDFLGGEETLRVTYILPPQEVQQEHLFGKRAYYGQVVELYYKEELIDTQANPRHLAGRSAAAQQQQRSDEPEFITEDMIQIDPGNSLLPPREGDVPVLPEYHDPNGAIPALPQR